MILVSSIEIESLLCFSCIKSTCTDVNRIRERVEELEKHNTVLTNIISKLQEIQMRRKDLEACFEGGKEAFSRDFSVEQDPHPVDSEESAMWQNGWIESARIKEAEDMREFIRWDFDLWIHLHELIINGCDTEELRVKSTLAPIKAMKFLPELLKED